MNIDIRNEFETTFFTQKLKENDSVLYDLILKERNRQKTTINLIASENRVSKAVLEAEDLSLLTNKYAEGYPFKRYYQGMEYADAIETLAIDRLKSLFGCNFANVQSLSGSQANQAIYLALLNPRDKVMGFSLDAGGHLTHGAKPNMSGKWFDFMHYGVDQKTLLIDMDEVEKIALEHKPKMIIAGCSAYPRILDFKRFREIADKVGAFLMADIAHYAGLIVAGEYPNPIEYAHVVTSTTHKTLRGPRGGIIMTNDEWISKKINSSVFPGMQGGPFMHIIAAKAVAFKEASSDEFKIYAKKVLENARIMSSTFMSRGIDVCTKGTDSHMVLLDLSSKDAINGDIIAKRLEQSGIICNKNKIPFDKKSAIDTSGIRVGSAAETTRGMGRKEFEYIANIIVDIIEDESIIEIAKQKVLELCTKFPFYQDC